MTPAWAAWMILMVLALLLLHLAAVRLVLPGLEEANENFRRGRLEAWLPLLLSLPLLGVALAGKPEQHSSTVVLGLFPAVIVPTLAAVLALAFLAPAAERNEKKYDPGESAAFSLPGRYLATWSVAGLLLILFAAADRIFAWQGQCLLTAALILFWLGIPDVSRRGVFLADRQQAAGLSFFALFLAVLAASAAGVFAFLALRSSGSGGSPLHDQDMAGQVIIITAVQLLLLFPLLNRIGRNFGIAALGRLAAVWAAMAGFLTLGAVSLRAMIIAFELRGRVLSWPGQLNEELMYNPRIWFPVNGLGALAFPAVFLLMAPLFWILLVRARLLHLPVRWLGVVILLLILLPSAASLVLIYFS